ncbi:uncharacterized protein [Cherax quadricarinatus]|nr:uncharacterized protein LOC128695440 [Cherax quadricarinatus]
MKSVALACLFLAVAVIAQDSYYTRKLPADKLRDFPGMCFGSTTCRVYKEGETWPLVPFCGNATCVKEGEQLFEQVQECPRAKPNPDCEEVLSDPTQVPFPACCPTYTCKEGVTVAYYTQAENEALIAEAAKAAKAAPPAEAAPAA